MCVPGGWSVTANGPPIGPLIAPPKQNSVPARTPFWFYELERGVSQKGPPVLKFPGHHRAPLHPPTPHLPQTQPEEVWPQARVSQSARPRTAC